MNLESQRRDQYKNVPRGFHSTIRSGQGHDDASIDEHSQHEPYKEDKKPES